MISKKAREDRIEKTNKAGVLYDRKLHEYEQALFVEKEKFIFDMKLQIEKNRSYNKSLIEAKNRFLEKDTKEVEKILEQILCKLEYVDNLQNEYEIEYIPNLEIAIISRKLPPKESLPEFSDIKLNTRKKELLHVKWKDKELSQFHENVIYQITLLTIYHVFRAVPKSVIDRIVFNGWIDHINKSTGTDETSCVITLDVDRDSFMRINLDKVDYKSCIRSLRGVFSPNFLEYSPVMPKLDLSRNDKRFVNSKDVSDLLNEGFNLATMEWDDFEHLIRQLFSKVFSSSNTEVRITQASRDGGVDAIAFDPDPIRGGKFVIQAKRYNILVPVSAVRDLYGTMLHEGASKGLLVTTSFFGRDAYSFAKDKPITLINGSELLGLLHQNGFNDTIIKLRK